MAYCYKCGKPLFDGNKFCIHCGAEQFHVTKGNESSSADKKKKKIKSADFKQEIGNSGTTKNSAAGKLKKFIKRLFAVVLIIVAIIVGTYYAYITYRDSQLIKKLENTPTSQVNGHYYVDLGLSVKWATMNVGASEPYEKGDFFAWGETKPKLLYDEKRYSLQYQVDSKIAPNSGMDAAYENWGHEWRMPSCDEYEELVKCCKWIWVSYGKYEGLIAVGPNGNSLFFPETGMHREEEYFDFGLHYWINESGTWHSCAHEFWDYYSTPVSNILSDDKPSYNGSEQRRYGLCVRAVYLD